MGSKQASVAVLVAVVASWQQGPAWAQAPSADELAAAYHRRGQQHSESGEHDAAIAEYRKAYELKAEPRYLFDIARSYANLGVPERAAFFYRRYLAAQPDAADRAEVEARIAELERALPAPAAPAAPSLPPEPPAASAPPLLAATTPPAPAPERTPSRWWLWTALGTVVAVGAVVSLVALRRRDETPIPRSDLGNWKL
jgi:tetratricopeptide (TPR) repeat protein